MKRSRLQDWLTSGTEVSPPTIVPMEDTPAAPAGPRFVDEGEVGRGASALVRRIYDRVLLRRSAVKVLSSTEPGPRARFLAEAQVTAQLEHPNIVPVHDFGTDEHGRSFMHMKLVEGESLARRIGRLGAARLEPGPLDELLSALVKVCDAVGYAHSRGVLHRDLKPSNVMLGLHGEVWLVDFGVAAIGLEPGEPGARVHTSVPPATGVYGTPAFMAPEQASIGPAANDPRADVYALGGLLYAILTSEPPNRGRDTVDVLANAGRVVPPDEVVRDRVVPAGLSRIALRALARDPADRHPSALAFKADLERFRRGAWHLPVRKVAAGTVLVREGDAGGEAYVLLRGRCRVSTAARGFVRELAPGDVFGEMAVLADRPRSSTVEAIDDVTVQVVTRRDLEEGLGLETWTGVFVKALVERFAELERSVR